MEEVYSNGKSPIQWKRSIPMEEVRSNGRNPFQWKKFIPMEEVHSIGGDGSYKTSSVEDKDPAIFKTSLKFLLIIFYNQ